MIRKKFPILLAILLFACAKDRGPTPSASSALAPPPPYAGMSLSNSASAPIGAKLFRENCASCHGETGQGDGPTARALRPPPIDISKTRQPDDYLFWRISEGGAGPPFNSAMPAWKQTLTDQDRWALVAHIHTLLSQ